MKKVISKLKKKSREKCLAAVEKERTEHLEWCKKVALKYVDAGDVSTAWTSMYSDLGKHPDTANHPLINVGMVMYKHSESVTPEEMRKFINRFK